MTVSRGTLIDPQVSLFAIRQLIRDEALWCVRRALASGHDDPLPAVANQLASALPPLFGCECRARDGPVKGDELPPNEVIQPRIDHHCIRQPKLMNGRA